MYRLALLSFHGCPVARLGEKDTGGMNVYVLQLARELARRGCQVDVLTRCHDPRNPQVVDLGEGARVVHLRAGPFHRAKETLYEYIPEFVGNVSMFQRSDGIEYDLIHSHYWLSGWLGMILSSRWSVPHVATFHTLAKTKLRARAGEKESELRVLVEGRVLRGADAVVVSTEDEREDLVRLYSAPARNVSVIPAGVDVELFQPLGKTYARDALGLTEKKIVLYVGRVEPLKGLDLLLNAVSRLADPSDTRVLVVGGVPGEGAELAHLKHLAAQLGIEDMVTFVGTVRHTELPKYYNAADVFAFPSYYESFGLAALEAMACGTPVVASRVGGLRTFVKHGETGYLIPWRRPEPFAQRLDTLLSNPALRETMGRAARAKAQEMTWGDVAERMLDVYTGLTGKPLQSAAGV